MDFFEEIASVKKDFPKVRTIKKSVKDYPLNFYQIFAIVMFIVCFFLGIIFGNLFATCEATSYFYSDVCLINQFNFSLMIVIWFISLLVSMFFFAIGHIVATLDSIDKKLK